MAARSVYQVWRKLILKVLLHSIVSGHACLQTDTSSLSAQHENKITTKLSEQVAATPGFQLILSQRGSLEFHLVAALGRRRQFNATSHA